jgi:NAD(P)-dependent dehydrogenase (short-subunit alcohol dehydrogenase family)
MRRRRVRRASNRGEECVKVRAFGPFGRAWGRGNRLAALEGATPQQIANHSAGNLLPVPWIEPEDVAQALLFLASDRARLVTGSQFTIDAGLLTH